MVFFRVGDAIEILEYVLKLREEKLGIANPDFEDEKRRLAELLKEAGKTRDRKAKSLENLIDPSSKRTRKEGGKQAYVSVERQNKHAENTDMNGCVDRCLPTPWSRPRLAFDGPVTLAPRSRGWFRSSIRIQD